MTNAFETRNKGGLQLITIYYLVLVLFTNYYICMENFCISSQFMTQLSTLRKY